MKLVFSCMVAVFLVSCKAVAMPSIAVEPGVSLALAEHRATTISNLHYTLSLDIPQDSQADINASITIEFDLNDNSAPLQLDFRQVADAVKSVRTNGERGFFQFYNEHIVLPAASLKVGHNAIQIQFIAGAQSLNRNPDYLYTLFVPDRARTAFPLFDQPDLKATYDLTLRVPPDWAALSNAPVKALKQSEHAREYQFARTALISSYLFSFVVGKFETVTQQRNGRSMTLFHRETDAAKVARNLDAIFQLHEASIDWMEDYTGISYPYQKFEFALIPAFQYGGMEHVGAVLYRASSLLLEETPSQTQLLNRASLIAHETAHMWFGNLVTMAWFDDVWTKEVFANFMAAKIINPSFPAIDHDLSFLVDHFPSAYSVDRTAGANSIRQALPNLRDAGQMYGSIIYHKAPIMMRQLELLLGPAALREGLREYLQTYSFSNATWPALIAILDKKTNKNLETWSQVWVNTAGRPIFSVDTDESEQVQLLQSDPLVQGRVWPQTFSLRVSADGAVKTTQITSRTSATVVPDLQPNESDLWLFNADGLGYGLFPADTRNLDHWRQLSSVEKASELINRYENLLAGSGSAEAYYLTLLKLASAESNQLLLQLLLAQISRIHTSFLSESQRHQKQLERLLWQAMLARKEGSARKIFFEVYALLATTPAAVDNVYRLWEGELDIDRLKLAESDYLELTQILAIKLPKRANAIIAHQLARTDNPDNQRKLEFLSPTLSADVRVRDTFFIGLVKEQNRTTESWVLQALRNLHHPSRIEHAEKYVLPSLELLEEIQATGDIFFPTGWLNATLRNHHSPAVIDAVDSFLRERPHYNIQLRMKILQAIDLPRRAHRLLSGK